MSSNQPKADPAAAEPSAPKSEGASDTRGAFLDAIIESLPAMVFVKDAADLRFERVNRAGERLIGISRDQLIGKNDYDFFPAEQAAFFVAKDREVLAHGMLLDIAQEPIETADGTRWLRTLKIPILDESGAPRHLLGVSLDITTQKQQEDRQKRVHDDLAQRVVERTHELERRMVELRRAEDALARTEAELRHAQKMEAIGRLAGGIAHDFNNLLSVVLGYSDLALSRVQDEDPMHRFLEQIHHAAIRASDLTQQLLAFGRRQVLKPKLLDLNEIVHGLEDMLSRLVGDDIRFSFEGAPRPAIIRADPSQIEQVIMNLVVNARDAMPSGGLLKLRVHETEVQDASLSIELDPGSYVVLEVRDNGIGMNAETQAQIFEPFFTTKDKGKGSGLGLSTVFGIVKQSGGTVRVESEPQRGASFSVYLPRAEGQPSAERKAARAAPEARGSEHILLVEDEPQVREFAATCLRQLGYRLTEADGPRSALRAAEGCGPIDLLLSDVVMPDGGGRALAEKLLAQRPGLRVLFMSGYTDDAIVKRGVLKAGVAFVQKPLTAKLLAARVREALADQHPTPPNFE
jgi:two-component system, cell cycle sensor histidine kinase and response regulator CckA